MHPRRSTLCSSCGTRCLGFSLHPRGQSRFSRSHTRRPPCTKLNLSIYQERSGGLIYLTPLLWTLSSYFQRGEGFPRGHRRRGRGRVSRQTETSPRPLPSSTSGASSARQTSGLFRWRNWRPGTSSKGSGLRWPPLGGVVWRETCKKSSSQFVVCTRKNICRNPRVFYACLVSLFLAAVVF